MLKTHFSGHSTILGATKNWGHCPRMPPMATGLSWGRKVEWCKPGSAFKW